MRVATTQWSQVLAARDGSDTDARAALESLFQTYWQPLYAYIRHQGASPEEASENAIDEEVRHLLTVIGPWDPG